MARLGHVCAMSQALAKPVTLLVLGISGFPTGPQLLAAKSHSQGGMCHPQSTTHTAPGPQLPRLPPCFAMMLRVFHQNPAVSLVLNDAGS